MMRNSSTETVISQLWIIISKHALYIIKFPRMLSKLLIEAYSQYTKHHSDLLTLKSLNFLPYDFGRIWAYIF